MVIDLLLACLAIVGGLVVLERAAEWFTDALGGLARRLRASEGTVGLLTAGGEWEELVVVVVALTSGHPGLAAGNIIGAAIANLIGSAPLGMLASRPLRPDRSARVYGLVMLVVTALAAGFAVDGRVSRVAGAVLVGVFAVYVLSVILVVRRGLLEAPREQEGGQENKPAARPRSTRRLVLVLVISLAVVALAAEAIVRGGVAVGQYAGLSDYVIGATIVAVGTTLPDKAFSLIGGLRGHSGVVTANALGSNIFILTLIFGLAALTRASGLTLAPVVAQVDVPLLLGISALTVALFFRARLHRVTGLALLAGYVAYIVYVVVRM